MNKENLVNQKYLKSILDYNSETGIFTWKEGNRKGQIAGYKGKLYKGSGGYILIRVRGKSYRAHRFAWLYMTGRWPKSVIDHINHKRDDNRWKNLRGVTRLQNQRNKKILNGMARKLMYICLRNSPRQNYLGL